MYKVFVNDTPVFLTSKKILGKNIKCVPLKETNIEQLVDSISKDEKTQYYLYHPNGELLLQKFKKKVEVVVAAGGLVRNKKNEILFIKRNGKWDLPKGRVEDNEKIEDAALRETEEETGVKNLEIVRPLKVTYHFFNRNEKLKLKETYWFEMKTDYNGVLKPETTEGIKKAVWKKKKKWDKTLEKAYANIKELFVDEGCMVI